MSRRSALARTLAPSLADVIAVTGREDRLAELLRGAATTRRQAYVRPVSKVAPLDRRQLEGALHRDYRDHMAATLSWGRGHGDAGDSGRGRA